MSVGAEPRPGLRDIEVYDSPQLDVPVRLNTNECPHPLPEDFMNELAETIRDLPLHRYPDGHMRRLLDDLAAASMHPASGVWVANGSNEVLTQLLQAYGGPGRRAAVFEPTYLVHARLARLTNTEVERLALPDGFVLGDAEVAAVVAAAPNVVFVCSPNNPTGNAQPLSAIVGIAQGLPNALVIVDEAYGEFAPAASAQALIATNPNIAITRTFSKAFALAGARIGYLLAAPAVIADLQRVRLPYHLSALTQTAGIVALHHREEASALLGAIRVQRDRISRELRTLPRVTVYPSDANFVLFVPPVDAGLVWQGLLDRGVLVRDLSAVVPNALRVTAGTEHEVDRFLTAIKEVLAA
jgi:histidinol-phosphate aminotransferase